VRWVKVPVAQGGARGRNNNCCGGERPMKKKKKLMIVVVVVTVSSEQIGLVEKVGPLLVTTILRWKSMKRRQRERKKRENYWLGKEKLGEADFWPTLD
jgi:hypothetical protein